MEQINEGDDLRQDKKRKEKQHTRETLETHCAHWPYILVLLPFPAVLLGAIFIFATQ